MIRNLYGAIDSHIEKYSSQLFTALPATVVSYDSDEQTISAQPVMLEPYADGVVAKMPQIDYVPVMFSGSGGGSLTFPVEVGDEVLLVFSSRNPDTWWDTGKTDVLPSTRRFNNLTDAMAIIGLKSKNKSLKAPTDTVELNYKDTSVQLKDDGKFAVENSSEELISLMSELVTEISKITTTTAIGVQPILNSAAFTALKTRLDTFKT